MWCDGAKAMEGCASAGAPSNRAMDWPAAFALTCAVEVPIVVAMAGRGRRRRTVADAFAANLLTHPLAWLLVEALVYRGVTRLPPARAFAAAGLANLITASLSFVV